MKKIKYTIHGFQQQKLIDLELNNDDALLLKVLKDSYSSTEFEHIIENNDKYIWINYTALLNYIPILGSRATIMRKIKRFEELGLIERVLKNEKNNVKGNFAYIKPTKNLDNLTEYTVQNEIPCIKLRQPLSQNETTLVSKRDNKDSINKDNINKDYYTPEQEQFFEILQDIENYPFDKKTDLSMYKRLEKNYPDVDLLAMINSYANWKLDKPLTKKCSPRSQINNQCKTCRKWDRDLKKDKKEGESKKGKYLDYDFETGKKVWRDRK